MSAGGRVLCLAGAVAALAVLVTGWRLMPDARGVGTHQQLGLAACGWLATTGYPCPMCGMTTAVSLASHGRWGASLATQPMGLPLAMVLATAFWPLMLSAVTGSRVAVVLPRLFSARILWVVLALMLAAWAYKAWALR